MSSVPMTQQHAISHDNDREKRRIATRQRNRQTADETALRDPRGKQVTRRVCSELSGIAVGTLNNWAHQDLKAGRTGPAPGSNRPKYVRYGTMIKYPIGDDGKPVLA